MKEQSRKQKWLNSMGKSQNLTLIVTGPVLTIFNPIWPKTRTPKDLNKFNQFYDIYQNSRKGLFVFFLCLIVMVWTIAEAFCLPSLFLWDWPEISALKSNKIDRCRAQSSGPRIRRRNSLFIFNWFFLLFPFSSAIFNEVGF